MISTWNTERAVTWRQLVHRCAVTLPHKERINMIRLLFHIIPLGIWFAYLWHVFGHDAWGFMGMSLIPGLIITSIIELLFLGDN